MDHVIPGTEGRRTDSWGRAGAGKGRRPSRIGLLAIAFAAAGFSAAPGQDHPVRSWLRVAEVPSVVPEDTDFEVKVDYSLVESEIPKSWPERRGVIFCWPNYPTQKQRHYSFGGATTIPVGPGKGQVTFTCRAPKYEATKSFTLIFWFAPSAKDRWKYWGLRWDCSVLVRRTSGVLHLGSDRLSNVFTDDEPVGMKVTLRNLKPEDIGKEWEVKYRVIETGGAEVDSGALEVEVQEEGQEVAIPWRSDRRGCFCLEAEIAALKSKDN